MALRLSLCYAALPTSSPPPSPPPPSSHRRVDHRRLLGNVRTLVDSTTGRFASSSTPVDSLRRGNWVKLICGASFEDVVDVRNLSVVYALAGVDCIDCAADASVVNAVNEGIEVARSIAPVRRPWVMVSVNDDEEDLHFRKAEFDPVECPPDCSRPCERICPADAISLERMGLGDGFANETSSFGKLQGGVKTERCYGCGRCFPACPYDKIRAVTYIRDAASTSELLKRDDVDAIEIHTRGRRHDLFKELWSNLGDSIQHLKLVAVSLPDLGESTVTAMHVMFSIMEANLCCYNLWQLDGRPMSGDIGRGATKDVIAFAARLTSINDRPDGFLQLAGGTNSHTIDYLKKKGLFQTSIISGSVSADETSISSKAGIPQSLIGGVAYGGYARKIIGRILQKLPLSNGHCHIEDHPDYLLEALVCALTLIAPVKCYELPI